MTLIERLELIAAWHLRGGPRPKLPMPNIYSTVTEAIAALRGEGNAQKEYPNG